MSHASSMVHAWRELHNSLLEGQCIIILIIKVKQNFLLKFLTSHIYEILYTKYCVSRYYERYYKV